MGRHTTLRAILYAHKKFLEGDMEAVCADLREFDLSKVDLRHRDLRKANLSRVNLEGADLRDADFSGANLSGANLHCCKLTGANFSKAILSRAFMAFVDLKNVNLTGADVTGADLRGVTFDNTKFGADWESKVQAAKSRIVPDGDVIGWKKLRGGKIAKLLIPKDAKRSNGFNRRCRAEYVQVLSIIDGNGRPCDEGISMRDSELKYVVGQTARPGEWDDDWKNDCSHGINFFTTYEEAESY